MHGGHVYSHKYLDIRRSPCDCRGLNQSSLGWIELVQSVPTSGCPLLIRTVSIPHQLSIHCVHMGKHLYLLNQKEARETCGIR